MRPENMAVRQAADALVEAAVKWHGTPLAHGPSEKLSRVRALEEKIRRYNEAKQRLTDTYKPSAGQMSVDDFPELFNQGGTSK